MSPKFTSILHLAQHIALMCCATGYPELFDGIQPGFRDCVASIDAPDWMPAGSTEREPACGQILVSVVERGT